VFDKIIPSPPHIVGFTTDPMTTVWEQDKIEIFVGRDKLIHDKERIVHGYIGVHSAMG
jgi:hypothetical protein